MFDVTWDIPASAPTWAEAVAWFDRLGYPAVLRASDSRGGHIYMAGSPRVELWSPTINATPTVEDWYIIAHEACHALLLGTWSMGEGWEGSLMYHECNVADHACLILDAWGIEQPKDFIAGLLESYHAR